MADRYPCTECRKDVSRTKNDRYRAHSDGSGEPCKMTAELIPEHVLAHGPVDGKTPADVPVEGVDYAVCPQCERKVKLTRLGYFEPHQTTLRGGERCEVGGVRAKHARRTEDVLLPGDERPRPAAQIPEVSAQEEITSPAPTSKSAGAGSSPKELPPTSGEGEIDWSDVEKTSPPAPAGEGPASEPGSSGASGAIDWSKVGDLKHLPSPESTPTSTDSQPPSDGPSTSSDAPGGPEASASAVSGPLDLEPAPFSLGASVGGPFLQPFSPFLQPEAWEEPAPVFLQPPEYEGPEKPEPMGELAKELATKIKETFYSYSNRRSADNRSAQTTLGPSEIGTPCDRRLAMALMGVKPVNAGGDGWAAFVGTCTHTGMAEVYTFADAGTGRYAVEMPVRLGVPTVPHGTTDLLDRRDGTIVDWKVMGAYSLKKFKLEGPTDTYRTQAQVYGLGAERAGEKVRNVAIVALPRAGSSLDEMHVWTEKYDRKFAEEALARVERIAEQVRRDSAGDGVAVPTKMEVAQTMPAGDDCRYCPFHLKGDKGMERGCPGK